MILKLLFTFPNIAPTAFLFVNNPESPVSFFELSLNIKNNENFGGTGL